MKEAGDKVDFLIADKHQCSLQVDFIFFGGCGWASLVIPWHVQSI